MRKVSGATVFAGLIALTGAAVAWRAVGYGLTGGGSPVGPGMFPAAVGLLLCAAGIATAVADARRAPQRDGGQPAGDGRPSAASQTSPAAAAEAAGEEPTGAAGDGDRLRRGFLLLAALAAAVALGNVIGLIPAMTLYLFVVTHLLEELPLTRCLLYAAGGGVFLWAVFDQLLNVRFPGPGW